MTARTGIVKRASGAPPLLALGAMNFGKRTPAGESEGIVRRAIERGITVFDTANSYNAGESERILGRALGRDRDRVTLSTKAGLGVDPGRPEGLSPEAMRGALAASLERLGTDRVDVYYLHVPDRATPIEKTLDCVAELVASGRVGAWGVSNYASWEVLEMRALAEARGLGPPVVTQLLYNVLHRELDVEYFAFARRYPIQTMAYNALAGGLLTGQHAFEGSPEKGSRFEANAMYRRRYWTREMFSRVQQVADVARGEGLPLVDLAYAWLASRPGVDSVLVGPATAAHLDDAIAAIERPLSSVARSKLDELARAWLGSDTHYVR
jgi:aryl-alcohol dehydrogenase-like predicted oxidoreductase